MEESLGAQYAIQIAVQTLRDRCKSLQHRVAVLEEENMNLRVQCSRNQENETSLTEIDKLKQHITELTEQKDQLQNRIRMICNENQDLWNKLGKLTTVNKNLGEQLHKINDTVTQVTSPSHQPQNPLIRSKTFTQNEPHTRFLQKNLEMNEKISLELEDISLKLSDSFSKQKMELDKLCSEMEGMQFNDNIITENCGFFYEELDEDLVEEVKYLIDNLKMLREEALQQKIVINKNLGNLADLKENLVCKASEKKTNAVCDRSTSTSDIPKFGVDKCTEALNFDNEVSKELSSPEKERVCPVCAKFFRKDVQFTEFHRHVEDHFSTGVESYEIL